MRKTLTGLVAIGLALALAACGSADDISGTQAGGVNANLGATIGIAMPTRTSERWIQDGKNMVEQFTAMGYKTELSFGDDDVKKQISQLEGMINNGDKLLVIGSIDGGALTDVLAKAAAKNIPVIAYDRLIRDSPNVDYYATFDNFRVGVLQASLLVERLQLTQGKGPFTIELFAGSPDDNNASFFFNGAMKVLRPYLNSGKLVVRSGQTDFKDATTLRWDTPTAQTRMTKILKANYQDVRLDAVLSPFDGMSIGIIKVLKANGYGTAAKPLPVVSGQDAQLPSVKSIIAGEQAGTIFKDSRELAKVAVQMGNAVLTGTDAVVNDTETYDNGVGVVPTYLLQPTAIDKSNYQTLLVDGGYLTAEELDS